jgi:uncharacterized protein (TIGR00297 family)
LVLAIWQAAVGIALTALLAYAAARSQALTARASAVAFVFGSLIVTVGGFPYLALLVLFVVGSVIVTRYKIEEKKRRHLQEGTSGERGVSNVAAHIVVPAGLVLIGGFAPGLLSWPTIAVLYAGALAFGTADTFASELGVLSGGARSLLTLRPVEAGTNGGVSVLGELWALVGALTTAIVAVALFAAFGTPTAAVGRFVGVAAAAGFLGCQVDSLLGETLENRGLLSKHGTNFAAMLASAAIAALLLAAAGG